MADYKLTNYQLEVVQKRTQSDSPYEVLLVALEMVNKSGNKDIRSYELWEDDVYNFETLKEIISNGLKEALAKNIKIGVSDFVERFYVTLTLPSRSNDTRQKRETHRFSARKQKKH